LLADTRGVRRAPRRTSATRVVGRRLVLPPVGRRLTIIADELVKTDFGTGALKITPATTPNDFEIGNKHATAAASAVIGGGTG